MQHPLSFQWKEADTIHELVDGIKNMTLIVHMLR